MNIPNLVAAIEEVQNQFSRHHRGELFPSEVAKNCHELLSALLDRVGGLPTGHTDQLRLDVQQESMHSELRDSVAIALKIARGLALNQDMRPLRIELWRAREYAIQAYESGIPRSVDEQAFRRAHIRARSGVVLDRAHRFA